MYHYRLINCFQQLLCLIDFFEKIPLTEMLLKFNHYYEQSYKNQLDLTLTNNKSSKSSPIKGFILINLMHILAYMPNFLSQWFSAIIAWVAYFSNGSSRKVTETNLRLCYPDLNRQEINDLTHKSIKSSSLLLVDMARVWLRSDEILLPMIHHVNGEELLINADKDKEKGTLIITPHIGNWELLFPYLLQHFCVSALCRPPKIAELEPVIRAGRQKSGGKIIRTTLMEVRKLLKVLKNGEMLVLLPDQLPQEGSGVLAPFYGHQAYTMTLLQGLAKRTGATILMATSIRKGKGFVLSFSEVTIDASLSEVDYATALNACLQKTIDRDPEQYEWAYKRFKRGPEGSRSYYD